MLDNRDLKLDRLKTLVIDEADDLLRDDTQAVVEDIERATPLNAQLAFSRQRVRQPLISSASCLAATSSLMTFVKRIKAVDRFGMAWSMHER